MISGGLDLSIPWTVAFTGVLMTGIVSHNPALTVWGVRFVLAVGIRIGAVNGLGIVVLGLPPFVMTLALNGILQTAALVYSNATPTGIAPRWLQWFMAGKVFGLAPVAWSLVLFAVISILLLSRTTFARRVYAIGNSSEAARLSGVRVGLVLVCCMRSADFARPLSKSCSPALPQWPRSAWAILICCLQLRWLWWAARS